MGHENLYNGPICQLLPIHFLCHLLTNVTLDNRHIITIEIPGGGDILIHIIVIHNQITQKEFNSEE